MIRARHIHSLNDFRQHASAHLERLAETGEPLVLTVNGEAKGVVLSPEAFDRLAEAAWQADLTVRLQRGLEEIRQGRGIEATEGLRRIAADMGIDLQR